MVELVVVDEEAADGDLVCGAGDRHFKAGGTSEPAVVHLLEHQIGGQHPGLELEGVELGGGGITRVAVVALQVILAIATTEEVSVVANSANQQVVARTTVEGVVATLTVEGIVVSVAVEDVIASGSIDRVVVSGTIDRVVVGGAGDGVSSRSTCE